MGTKATTKISVQATIDALLETVWKFRTTPEAITGWNSTSDEWHTPRAENDLRPGE